jgi:putative phosphoribosyl transferase
MGKIVEELANREKAFLFWDRFDAGKQLAKKFQKYSNKKNVLILAIPSGGVPVGYSIAKELSIPMDVFVVRKIQVPWNTEAGFGALTYDGEMILNEALIRDLGLTAEIIEEPLSKTKKVLSERVRKFRGKRSDLDIAGKEIVLVDDGLASGFTMFAAVKAIIKKSPKSIVIAIPTSSGEALKLLKDEVDGIICLNVRSGPIFAVADAYKNWYDLSDNDVLEILKEI